MNPTPSTVKATPLAGRGRSVAACLSNLSNVCAAGAQSADVQASPVALAALGGLKKAVTTATTSLASRQALAQALMTAIRVLGVDFEQVKTALSTYEVAIDGLANGSASVITKAGLPAKGPKPAPTALGPVTEVFSKPGKSPTEAILSWPAGPGATSYAIQVSFTPQNPAGPFTALASGTARRRVVKAPTPGAQFLVQVASLASDGAQSAWSAPILATAL
jgi:hypothetical protein